MSVFTVPAAAIPVGIILLVVVTSDDRAAERERAEAAMARRGQAALDALRALGRDYPRPKGY